MSDRLVEAGLERATHWGWPNIYTYTKSLGEQLVAHSGLKFAIARPACCESTVAYPFEGWNEGISTSAPIIYLIMKGQVQLPLAQSMPPAHAVPQLPQFDGSVWRSVQAFPQAVPAQKQIPLTHSWFAGQAWPQRPQFWGSVAVSTQPPPQAV